MTGATGGVGSVAVGILAGRGYEVAASTGKPDADGLLKGLGAAGILGRDETSGRAASRSSGALGRRRRLRRRVDAALHPAHAELRRRRCGVRQHRRLGLRDDGLPVHPARGRARSASTPSRCRSRSVAPCGSGSPPTCVRAGLDDIGSREVSLAELPSALDAVLAGANTGRTLVRL